MNSSIKELTNLHIDIVGMPNVYLTTSQFIVLCDEMYCDMLTNICSSLVESIIYTTDQCGSLLMQFGCSGWVDDLLTSVEHCFCSVALMCILRKMMHVLCYGILQSLKSQHGGCSWLGAYLVPGHLQLSLWIRWVFASQEPQLDGFKNEFRIGIRVMSLECLRGHANVWSEASSD